MPNINKHDQRHNKNAFKSCCLYPNLFDVQQTGWPRLVCLFVDAGEGISTRRRQFGLIKRGATLQQYFVDIVDSRDKKEVI